MSFFFFKQKTAYEVRISDWSSDVCSSDLDGNDPLAVYAATKWASDRARANAGPTLIEHFTYRAEGHSTSDDPSQYRSARESDQWPLGDPIARLKRHLISLGIWDMDRYAALDLRSEEHTSELQSLLRNSY